VDGTQIRANASKHKNLSYDRAGELDARLELDIAELMRKAEAADAADDLDGRRLPKEIARREKLRAKMQKAMEQLDGRARERAEKERAAYEEKVARRQHRKGRAKGCEIKPPKDTPDDAEQINLTDADSRIMRKNKRSEYTQAYNAQAAVDAGGTQLILSSHVTNCPSDANELVPAVEAVSQTVEPVFGIIKHVLGFRQFLHRGLTNVRGEWELVCLAYNVKRLFRLKMT